MFRVTSMGRLNDSTALEGMHLSGWMHCDVSAGNILVDAEGRTKLVDMEYARRIEADVQESQPVG